MLNFAKISAEFTLCIKN